MKKIIENLENQFEKLQLIVEKRNDKVLNASEKWQESEKCDEWEYKTEDIENLSNELLCIIEQLKEI